MTVAKAEKVASGDVYKCIAAVSAEIAKEGIAKSRKNAQQGYSFRGVDDVYNALAPVLAKNGLVILPRILSREVVERQTQKGGTLFYVTVAAEFDFVAASDGSMHTARTYGEAMDSADKATNKAMSAAYKYLTFQAFCIPTEGDNDADGTTHEPTVPVVDKYQEWLTDLEAVADEGYDKLVSAISKAPEQHRTRLKSVDLKTWHILKARAEKAHLAGQVISG